MPPKKRHYTCRRCSTAAGQPVYLAGHACPYKKKRGADSHVASGSGKNVQDEHSDDDDEGGDAASAAAAAPPDPVAECRTAVGAIIEGVKQEVMNVTKRKIDEMQAGHKAELDEHKAKALRAAAEHAIELQSMRDKAAAELRLQAQNAEKERDRLRQQARESEQAVQAANRAAIQSGAKPAALYQKKVKSLYEALASGSLVQMQAQAMALQQDNIDATAATAALRATVSFMYESQVPVSSLPKAWAILDPSLIDTVSGRSVVSLLTELVDGLDMDGGQAGWGATTSYTINRNSYIAEPTKTGVTNGQVTVYIKQTNTMTRVERVIEYQPSATSATSATSAGATSAGATSAGDAGAGATSAGATSAGGAGAGATSAGVGGYSPTSPSYSPTASPTRASPTTQLLSPHPPAQIPKPIWCADLVLEKAFPLPSWIDSFPFSAYDFNGEDNCIVYGAKALAELGTYWASMSESYIYAPEKSTFWVRPRALRQWIEWAKSGHYDSVRVVAHGCAPKSYESIVGHPIGFDPFNYGSQQNFGYGTYTSLTTHAAASYTTQKGSNDYRVGQMVLCLLLCKGDEMPYHPNTHHASSRTSSLSNMQKPYYRYEFSKSKVKANYERSSGERSLWCDAVVVREGSLLLPLGVVVPK